MRQLGTLKAWTESKLFAREAYRATMQPPLDRHFGLADQIRRAAVSVPANVVEGYALGTRPQLLRHLRIALASAREVSGHLEFAADLQLMDGDRARRLLAHGDTVIKLLVGLLRKLG